MKNKGNKDAFDDLLKQAVTEKFEEELQSVLCDPDLDIKYEASHTHKSKMDALFSQIKRETNFSRFLNCYSKMASVVLLVLIIGSAFVMIMPGVRSNLLSVIRDTVNLSTDEPTKTVVSELMPAYVPEGYFITYSTEIIGGIVLEYTSPESGSIIIELRETDTLPQSSSADFEYELRFEGDVVVRQIEEQNSSEEGSTIYWQTGTYSGEITSQLSIAEMLKICVSIG